MIVISLTSCIGANGNGGNVRGASVIAVVAAAACGGAASAVVELVYRFPQAAAPLVPRPHTTVVGYFREPAFFAEQRRPGAAPPDSVARRLLAGLARSAVHRTAPHGASSEALVAPL